MSAGDVLGGAAKGAAAGSVAGPVGAVVGGVLGAIGGLFSSSANNARKAALKEQRIIAERQAGIQRRDIVRSIRFAQAQALVAGSSQDGGLESSAVLGSLSSIGSQGESNLAFFDSQIGRQRKVNKYLNKADQYDSYAGAVNSIISLGSTAYDSGFLGGKKTPASASPASLNNGFGQIGSFQSSFDRALINGWPSDVPTPILGTVPQY